MISKKSTRRKRLTFQMFALIAGNRWSQASIGVETTAFLNAGLALLRDGCVPMRLNIRKNVDIRKSCVYKTWLFSINTIINIMKEAYYE